MKSFATEYLGLRLKSPILVSSSGLTSTVASIEKLAEHGAGAVVLKSLFEEQILQEAGALLAHSDYPEAEDYLQGYVTSNSVEQYLDLIAQAKRRVDIPIMASINCFSASQWVEFAQRIEAAGADALEINVFNLPTSPAMDANAHEGVYLALAEQLAARLRLPIAFKLGMHFTNPLNLAQALWYRGAKGVVLFNRLYAPDIDIDELKVRASEIFSHPADIRYALRWVGMCSHALPHVSVSATTGVHSGQAVVKMLLAGAHSVQVCSALYQKGPEHLAIMHDFLGRWMEKKGYHDVASFRGLLSHGRLGNTTVYERSQFMKHYSAYE